MPEKPELTPESAVAICEKMLTAEQKEWLTNVRAEVSGYLKWPCDLYADISTKHPIMSRLATAWNSGSVPECVSYSPFKGQQKFYIHVRNESPYQEDWQSVVDQFAECLKALAEFEGGNHG